MIERQNVAEIVSAFRCEVRKGTQSCQDPDCHACRMRESIRREIDAGWAQVLGDKSSDDGVGIVIAILASIICDEMAILLCMHSVNGRVASPEVILEPLMQRICAWTTKRIEMMCGSPQHLDA